MVSAFTRSICHECLLRCRFRPVICIDRRAVVTQPAPDTLLIGRAYSPSFGVGPDPRSDPALGRPWWLFKKSKKMTRRDAIEYSESERVPGKPSWLFTAPSNGPQPKNRSAPFRLLASHSLVTAWDGQTRRPRHTLSDGHLVVTILTSRAPDTRPRIGTD